MDWEKYVFHSLLSALEMPLHKIIQKPTLCLVHSLFLSAPFSISYLCLSVNLDRCSFCEGIHSAIVHHYHRHLLLFACHHSVQKSSIAHFQRESETAVESRRCLGNWLGIMADKWSEATLLRLSGWRERSSMDLYSRRNHWRLSRTAGWIIFFEYLFPVVLMQRVPPLDEMEARAGSP